VAEGYAARRPAEVAVVEVTGSLPRNAAAAIRERLRTGLLDRRYAPLRDRAVDGDREAFRPGGATAVLVVTVDLWDDTALHGAGRVWFGATARLHAAGTGEVLYEARISDFGVDAGYLSRTREDRPRALEGAASEAADLLLRGLPVKGDG